MNVWLLSNRGSVVAFVPQVYSTNFELVGRMAPLKLTVSPKLAAPIASFFNSSKVKRSLQQNQKIVMFFYNIFFKCCDALIVFLLYRYAFGP